MTAPQQETVLATDGDSRLLIVRGILCLLGLRTTTSDPYLRLTPERALEIAAGLVQWARGQVSQETDALLTEAAEKLAKLSGEKVS